MGADGAHALKFRDPPQHQVIFGRQLGLPALFDNDRLVRLDDDGRSSHLLSRDERLARIDGGAVPFSAGEEPRAARRRRTLCPRQFSRLLLEDGAAAHGFDRHRLDDQQFLSVDESELRLMRALEAGFHFLQGHQLHLLLKGRVRFGGFDNQRRVRSRVADVRAHVQRDLVRCDALPGDFLDRGGGQPARHPLQRLARLVAERLLDRLLADAADVGKPHAVGGEQRRVRMDQHARHAERVGDQAGVLAAGAAEAVERIARHVVAALHRNFLDRVCHVLDRDLDEAVGDLFGRAAVADFLGQRRECRAHRAGVERLILLRPEYFRKEVGNELADHDIGIGHGERAAAPIAFRPRIGAGGVGADAKAGAVEVQDRAAAGCHRMDQHHRRAHAHAGDFSLEGALVFAGEMRHVGRGAAHVEADQPRKPGLAPGLGHADDACRRPREDSVLAAEQLGGRQPARRHHEHELRPLIRLPAVQFFRHLRHVAAQDRRQIAVDHGGVAAPDELDQRRDFVAGGNLLEAHFACQRGEALFVAAVAIGMHQHHGDRADTVILGAGELGAHRLEVRFAFDRAVGAHPLIDLDHPLVEHVRLDDMLRENLRPRLVADPQRVAKTLGDQKERALALALKERIGRNRGAHLHGADARRGNGLAGRHPKQVADAGNRGIAIGFGIFRKQLVGDELAVRPAADHVGKGAAAIDPKFPASTHRLIIGSPPVAAKPGIRLRVASGIYRLLIPLQDIGNRPDLVAGVFGQAGADRIAGVE